MVSKGQGKGGLELPAILKTIDIKKIQIGLIASCATMLIILIICFATYGWLSCDGGLKTSLSEYKTKGGSGKLSGKFKDEGETMAGLGAMAWIFMLISGVLAFLIMQQLCGAGGNLRKYYLMGGLASVGLCWLFLTAGWGRFADTKGGSSSGCDFGASFAFTVIIWLCLFPYAFFWFLLFARANDETSEDGASGEGGQQAQPDGEPDQQAYAPSYTAHNAGQDGAAAAPASEPPVAPAGDSNADKQPEDNRA